LQNIGGYKHLPLPQILRGDPRPSPPVPLSFCPGGFAETYMFTVYAVLVSLSIRSSPETDIVSKWLNTMVEKTPYVSTGTLFFCCQRSWQNYNGDTPDWSANAK